MILLLLACHAPPPPALSAFAAASLTDVLPQVAGAWQAEGGGPLTLSFDASSRLAKQMEAGAPTDLFFSADAAWMDELQAKGLIDPGSRRDLLGNALVVVVPAEAPELRSLTELTEPRVARLALAGEAVPAGRYARQALGAAGVLDAVSGRVSSAEDVRTVLAWVARGEADAGLVYATDARVEPRVRVALVVDSALYTPIIYPAASTGSSAEARRFLDFCQGPAARALFEDAGFRVLP